MQFPIDVLLEPSLFRDIRPPNLVCARTHTHTHTMTDAASDF